MNKSTNLIVKEIQSLIEGKTISEIINLETDNIYNKSAASVIVKNYINKNCLYNLEDLKNYKVLIKFIPVDSEYKCYEAMSFTNSSLYNIIFEDWDSIDPLEISTLKKQLDFNFLFIPIIKIKTKGVFNNYSDWKIGDFSLWKPNHKELELIGKEWNHSKKTIQSGVKLQVQKHGKSFRTANNLPKQSETDFIHLRPHGKNSLDYDIGYLNYTNGDVKITKQSFWLNKNYINTLLSNYKWKMNLKEE